MSQLQFIKIEGKKGDAKHKKGGEGTAVPSRAERNEVRRTPSQHRVEEHFNTTHRKNGGKRQINTT